MSESRKCIRRWIAVTMLLLLSGSGCSRDLYLLFLRLYHPGKKWMESKSFRLQMLEMMW